VVPVRIPADGGRCLGRAHSGAPHSPVLRTWEMQHAAHSLPRATRLFRLAEQARCWGPAAAGAEGNDRAGVFATVTVAANSAPALFSRRIGGWTPPHGFVPLNAPPAWTAEGATRLGSGVPAGLNARQVFAAAHTGPTPLGRRAALGAPLNAPPPRLAVALRGPPGPPSAGLSLEWIVAVQFVALPLTPFQTVES